MRKLLLALLVTATVHTTFGQTLRYDSATGTIAPTNALKDYPKKINVGTITNLGSVTAESFLWGDLTTTNSVVVTVGDSITFGSGASTPWPSLLSTVNAFTVHNSAVSGHTTWLIITNFSTEVAAHISRKAKNNIVTVFIGSNDGALYGATARHTANRLAAYCRQLKLAGAKPVVLTMISRVGYDTFKNSYNALIRDEWRTYADAIADVADDALLGADGAYSNATYFADNIHPTDAGHALIAAAVSPVLDYVETNGAVYAKGLLDVSGSVAVNGTTVITNSVPVGDSTPLTLRNPETSGGNNSTRLAFQSYIAPVNTGIISNQRRNGGWDLDFYTWGSASRLIMSVGGISESVTIYSNLVVGSNITAGGTLTVGRNPTAALEVATKGYTDTALAGALAITGLTNTGLTRLNGALTVTNGITLGLASSLSFPSGVNQRAGNATLVTGTVTVNNTTVTANTVVLLTRKTSGGTIGLAITYTVSAGTSFTISSDSAIDTSTFSYLLIEVP